MQSVCSNLRIGSETPKRNAFDHVDKSFENLNSISNIFQETQFQNFDGLSNYLYLFKKVIFLIRETSVIKPQKLLK